MYVYILSRDIYIYIYRMLFQNVNNTTKKEKRCNYFHANTTVKKNISVLVSMTGGSHTNLNFSEKKLGVNLSDSLPQ